MVLLRTTIAGALLVVVGALLLTVIAPYITVQVQSVQRHDVVLHAGFTVGQIYGGVDRPLSYSLPGGVSAIGTLGVVQIPSNQSSDIQLTVYDADNYQKWAGGQQSTFAFLNDVRDHSNFTFTTSNSGPYYFVFDNTASPYKKYVTISLGYNQVATNQIPDPRVPYVAWSLLGAGVIVLAIGLIKKPPISWA
jgi:hypothetical protein